MVRLCTVFIAGTVLAAAGAFAATPPAQVNYQGVLRDAGDRPLTGSYDMVLSFWDAAVAGNEILDDSHLGSGTGSVSVSGGLFNVALGSGTVIDAPGPGTYTSLDQVFRDYPAVWLQVKIGTETLSPRTQIIAAAYALNTTNLNGQPSSNFLDVTNAAQTKGGSVTFDNGATGSTTAVTGKGGNVGGSFSNYGGSGQVNLAKGDTGILASGSSIGVQGQGAWGVQGVGTTYGVTGEGDGVGATGVYADGLTYGVVGYGRYYYGGEAAYFKDIDYSGSATLGVADTGVIGSGNFMGGKFTQGTASGVEADLCYNSTAVAGYAHNAGENPAWFQDLSAGSYAAVGKGGYKIGGNGAVSFIQNDPTDSTRQIVYTAPEGDEVAVYTRGEAKLINGEAHVALGATFQWVANPDIGLTATATPRGELVPIQVESISPGELVVKGPAGSNAAFDFMVWGLRIGFEDRPVVQPKEHESPIPNLSQDAAIVASHPELKAFTASSRHAAMQRAMNPAAPVKPDLSRSASLKASIGVYDPVRDMPPQDSNRVTVADPAMRPERPVTPPVRPVTPGTPQQPSPAPPVSVLAPVVTQAQAPVPTWPVSEPVEAGDLLTLDPAHPGHLYRATTPADPNVVGFAASDSGDVDGSLRVPLVDTFYPHVKADASSAPIHPGDLLVSSAMPGYVMRAPEGATISSIVGKAMDGLDSGTGTIAISRTGR